jgi:hypothetical protein
MTAGIVDGHSRGKLTPNVAFKPSAIAAIARRNGNYFYFLCLS